MNFGIQDIELASNISTISEKQHFHREVASTAETGWDFSTGWMRNYSNFTTLATTSILPVDLNVLILGMEHDIAFLAKATRDSSNSERFLKAAEARHKAINFFFWNAKKGQWLDYWLSDSKCNAEE